MFYDTERIIRKQLKYEKIKAYAIISGLEGKGLSLQEMIEAINILLDDKNTEFQAAVLSKAKSILESRKEIKSEEGFIRGDSGDDGSDIDCPALQYQRRFHPV